MGVVTHADIQKPRDFRAMSTDRNVSHRPTFQLGAVRSGGSFSGLCCQCSVSYTVGYTADGELYY